MENFETVMMSNFIVLNLAVALISAIFSALLARRIRAGFLLGLMGFLLAFVAALCVAAAGTWVIAAIVSPKVLLTTVRMPLGALSWSLVTGIEFLGSGSAVGWLSYLIFRLRRRPAQKRMV